MFYNSPSNPTELEIFFFFFQNSGEKSVNLVETFRIRI